MGEQLTLREFMAKFDKNYKRDVVIMIITLIMLLALCIFSLTQEYYGLASIFSFFSMLDVCALVVYKYWRARTSTLISLTDEGIEKMLDQWFV